ncbi:MAG: hypothetical protein Q9167_001365 [Letrouitia subvulpina]
MKTQNLLMAPKQGKVGLEGDNLLQGDKSNLKSKPEVTVQEKHYENLAVSNDDARQAPPAGIYCRSPLTMMANFICGCGCALALHGYYSSLHHKTVGSFEAQGTSLRIGTALAFIAQVCLVVSIQYAHIQWLWRSLKNRTLSIRAVNSAFNATQTLWSYTNLEMLSKLRLASIVALVGWFLPITTVFTPATLSVQAVVRDRVLTANVPTLRISQAEFYHYFAYSVSTQDAGGSELERFSGPRTILKRLSIATATTGEILPIIPPLSNLTYEQTFFGPCVRCLAANETIAAQIDAANDRRKSALPPWKREVQNYYWAFVPAFEGTDKTLPSQQVEVANLSDVDGALRSSNQLWLRYPQLEDGDTSLDVTEAMRPQYLVCELQNASYNVNFTWTNGIQTLDITGLHMLGSVPYPVNSSSYSNADKEIMSFSAYAHALSSQLTGSIGFFQDLQATNDSVKGTVANRTYSELDSKIVSTLLLGSAEFNSFFQKNYALSGSINRNQPFSKGRLQDMALARNRTLQVLIEELASNITLGLISNTLFSPPTMNEVTTHSPVNVYIYRPRNVLIAYGIAISFAFIANLLGAYAYFSNGESYENSWSAMVFSSRGVHRANLNDRERSSALPLLPRVARMRIRYTPGGGFRIAS